MNPKIFALTSMLLIAGCGGPAAWNGGSSPPPRNDTQVTITVTSTFVSHDPLGTVLTEGALAQVLLYDANGHLVATRTSMPGEPVAFRQLRPGQYVLSPALQPCNGNCGTLDGRINPCRTRLDVQGDVRVRVHYQVNVRCTIST